MKKTFVLSSNMSLATTKVGAFQFTTPAGVPVVLKAASFSSDKTSVSMSLLEDYTFAAAGTALVPTDTFRTAPRTPRTTVKAHTDITAVAGAAAKTLENVYVQEITNKISLNKEWTLKPSTTYLLAISNQNAGTASVGYCITLEE